MVVALLVAMCLIAEPQAVHIVRIPATAHRITFDPKSPQPYVPKLKDQENALTQARSDAGCTFTHEVLASASGEVTLRLTGVRISLSMDNTIYLPTDVRPPLRVHEEGHRVINERIYDNEAEAIARRVADRVLAKPWTAVNVERATAAADEELRAQYREQIARRIAEVNARFDEMTKHGSRDDISVVDAVDQAFTSVASTQPTTSHTPPPAPRAER